MKNVRFHGDKPYKVAVVHGGPGAPGSVAAIARVLSEDVGVIEPFQTETTINNQLTELDEVVRTSCRIPITLVGHSWGAWLVFLYAAKHPELAKKIILVGSGPFDMKYVKRVNKNRRNHLTETEGKEYEYLLKKMSTANIAINDGLLERIRRLVAKSDNYNTFCISTDEIDCLKADEKIYRSIWNEAAIMRESGELLAQASFLTCPVVAIHGDYDPHPADGVSLPLGARLPNFTFYLLERCGHSPWKEKYATKRFYEILKEEM